MNQEKIGKFIKERRKTKNLTQEELAKKLNVTDRAVGNWEKGRRMPDYSILKDLCTSLDITINELLSAEKLEPTIYQTKAEENLMTLKRQIDKRKKIAEITEYIFVFLIILMFIGNMVLNYIYRDNWDNTYYGEISWVFCILMTVSTIVHLNLIFEEKSQIKK